MSRVGTAPAPPMNPLAEESRVIFPRAPQVRRLFDFARLPKQFLEV
jgi:hypothetical protein